MLKPQSISFKGGTARFTYVEPEPEPVFEPQEETTTNPIDDQTDWEDITGRQ